MAKKVYKQKCFSTVIATNSNWELLTKNLIYFKRWDRVMVEKFYYYGDSLKNLICRGEGSLKNSIYRRGLPKKGRASTVCRFTRSLGKKEGDNVFERGLIPQCTLWTSSQVN